MRPWPVIPIFILLVLVPGLSGQSVSRADVGKDGTLRLAYADGETKIVPPEPQQVGCDKISIGKDKHIVGWSVLVKNCCTSYPIPTSVVLLKDGRKTVISTGQMIYEWRFMRRGKRIAVLSGPVHGAASAAHLYSSRTGKLLSSWDGNGAVPKWAEGWEKEFQAEQHAVAR